MHPFSELPGSANSEHSGESAEKPCTVLVPVLRLTPGIRAPLCPVSRHVSGIIMLTEPGILGVSYFCPGVYNSIPPPDTLCVCLAAERPGYDPSAGLEQIKKDSEQDHLETRINFH